MSLMLRTDVTSVKIHGNYILAGVGSFINIFVKVSGELLQRLLCLNGQKIYVFLPSQRGQEVLVIGGKQFTAVAWTTEGCKPNLLDDNAIRLFDPVVCDDWIHSGVWLDEDNVALLTAHNVIQFWNIRAQSLTSQWCSRDNSILYSGLIVPLKKGLLVLAGTVFSEVIVHGCTEEPLHRLRGHKGVIFSISCDLAKGAIVTTSDDRSVRIWAPNDSPGIQDHPADTMEYWKHVEIVCKHELYGHTARVMRSCVAIDKIVSVGEDSAICFWNLDGSLAKKIVSHQNACIWSVDADNDTIVTGGGDCAVITHPLTIATDYSTEEALNLDIDIPKKIVITARRNLVILNENNELFYYNSKEKTNIAHKLDHESTYKLISISSCKQMVAVADMNGKLDVFAENCRDSACLINIIDTKLTVSKILSMQWAGNRHLALCSENGQITIIASKGSSSETYDEFVLPPCKERWLTASAVDNTTNIFVFGDRCGNIHVYAKGHKTPIKSFSKAHGRYGPTSITIKNTDVITTGRDGSVKYFSFDEDVIEFMYSRDLEFKWVEKFLDKEESIVCGFQERIFMVYNMKSNSKMLEVPCGGGHRSWDAIRFYEKVDGCYEEFIEFVYLKNSSINTVQFQLNKVISKNIINSLHSKEINCLQVCKSEKYSNTFYVSGGEDTTLRISSINVTLTFEDQVIFKQLSSIRTLKMYPLDEDSFLLMSAGGRAQICIRSVTFHKVQNKAFVKPRELTDYMVKGSDKTRKCNQNWRNCSVDFDPETRIMDVDCIKTSFNKFTIFAGCSDAILRVFTFSNNPNVAFEMTKELKYHKTCILKTICVHFSNREILITCTTRGDVAFWDVTDSEIKEPFFVSRTNKSGINSITSKTVSTDGLLIATGGDDNAMHLLYLKVTDQNDLSSLKVLDAQIFDKHHSSEITGLCILHKYLLSTSIDQRVSLFEWEVSGDAMKCKFLSQTYSDVADIQGINLVNHTSCSITVCVFGKGMEVIEISTALT